MSVDVLGRCTLSALETVLKFLTRLEEHIDSFVFYFGCKVAKRFCKFAPISTIDPRKYGVGASDLKQMYATGACEETSSIVVRELA